MSAAAGDGNASASAGGAGGGANGGGGTVGEYEKAVGYWDAQPATCDGVLGGFGHVSDADLRDSEELLLRALSGPLEESAKKDGRRLVAVDCGAGVGRVTGGLLLRHFQQVDLLEPSRHLLDTAVRDLAARAAEFPAGHKVGRVICKGLQEWEPLAPPAEEEGGGAQGGGAVAGEKEEAGAPRYDCIWVQWCLLYLTDGESA
jgi:protein N-terminal methyltransferase